MNRSSFLWDPAARRLPVASLLFVGFALAVSVVPGFADWLQFDRHAIARGELWCTGHVSLRALVGRPFVLGYLGTWNPRVAVRTGWCSAFFAVRGRVGRADSTDTLLRCTPNGYVPRVVRNRFRAVCVAGRSRRPPVLFRKRLVEIEHRRDYFGWFCGESRIRVCHWSDAVRRQHGRCNDPRASGTRGRRTRWNCLRATRPLQHFSETRYSVPVLLSGTRSTFHFVSVGDRSAARKTDRNALREGQTRGRNENRGLGPKPQASLEPHPRPSEKPKVAEPDWKAPRLGLEPRT